MREVDPGDLQVGDIIAFRPRLFGEDVVTHRIVEIVRERGEVVRLRTQGDVVRLRTQGDVHPEPDAPITPAHLVGKVSYAVPLVGSVVRSPLVVASITLLGLGLLGVTITAFVPSMRFHRH